MHRNISQLKKRQAEQKRRKKKRIQLFLNIFMLVCILIIAFCIGILGSRDGTADIDFKGFMSRIEYAVDERGNFGDGNETLEIDHKLEKVNDESDDFEDDFDNFDEAPDGLEHDWRLTLVNKWNPLPERVETEIVELANGERVDKRIYPYLQKMFDDARAAGIYPIVRSGYRTRREQEEIYDGRIQEYQAEGMSAEEAKAETELWVAVPGTSEHELGLAVDINADKIHSGGAEVYAWLKDHAHLYGFINRYPSDKTEITGVANEPWHYRYVGVETAAEIYERGICLEEYLAGDVQ